MENKINNFLIKYKKPITIIIFVLIIVLFITILLSFTKRKIKEVSTPVAKENITQENTEPEKAQKKPKVEKAYSVTDKYPVYKKSEKNIKIPVLIYHAFQSTLPPDDKYKLFVTSEKFEEQIKALVDDGYTFIAFEDLIKYNNEQLGLPEKVVLITMDDGWEGEYRDAYPILLKYNLKATIFIVNDLMGTPGYMNWDQAKEMYNGGLVKIHTHGKKHIEYSQVAKSTLVQDVTYSQNKIDEMLGEPQEKIFAYPSGKYSAASISWLKEIGFDVQVLTKYGTVNSSANLDLTNIGRIRCEQTTTGKHILDVINNTSL
ncbi:MAG: polysaccharide deacetylase family protein [Clostridia bacterium]